MVCPECVIVNVDILFSWGLLMCCSICSKDLAISTAAASWSSSGIVAVGIVVGIIVLLFIFELTC